MQDEHELRFGVPALRPITDYPHPASLPDAPEAEPEPLVLHDHRWLQVLTKKQV